ncbi:hypothetical protein B0T17DRAFT_491016 [Bombardia bombarda]|uniref:ENTH domain-containing protein n=1 Tax=Bombardia bombarda TaxID=252184 RepID=A0AA39XA95_9PEZI|nr:hypothetical protein B0T17DRAFT_491016 [Bombardia bombarda]
MDLKTLKNTVSNLTLYDIKAGVRKVQNVVMNYTEMETKVREATNNDQWPVSNSLKREIASGTFNYQTMNEIMPFIYRRFTEKSAEEWAQIWKGLALLEFLIVHGSERVIDNAVGHLPLIKMLRQFQYIGPKGEDWGKNVRTAAMRVVELLTNIDLLRSERKKAKDTNIDTTGIEGGASKSTIIHDGSGSSGRVHRHSSGGLGGHGDDAASRPRGDGGILGMQEVTDYNEFHDGASSSSPAPVTAKRAGVKKTIAPAKKKEPERDLFDFDTPDVPSFPTAPSAAPFKLNSLAADNDDDEFDDFQSASPAPVALAPNPFQFSTQLAAPKPVSAQQANLSGMLANNSFSPPLSSTTSPAGNFQQFPNPFPVPAIGQASKAEAFQVLQPNYLSPVTLPQQTGSAVSPGGSKSISSFATSKPAAGDDAFGAVWTIASGGIKKTTPTIAGRAMGELAKEKTSVGIWGPPASSSTIKPMGGSKPLGGPSSGSNGLDDLLG